MYKQDKIYIERLVAISVFHTLKFWSDQNDKTQAERSTGKEKMG